MFTRATNRLSRGLYVVAAIAAAAPVVGCGIPPAESARKHFAEAYACPEDRLAVTETGEAAPPADLGNDPERIAMWRKRHAERYLRVEGCGKTLTYFCMESELDSGVHWCAPHPAAAREELMKRASAAMSCPNSALRVVPNATNSFVLVVEGCGKRGTFLWGTAAANWQLSSYPIVAAPALAASTPAVPPSTPPAPSTPAAPSTGPSTPAAPPSTPPAK
jgi:hypothetical protein